MTSFLLAHCGGGQDKPGCLGPSAKLPRRFFFVQQPVEGRHHQSSRALSSLYENLAFSSGHDFSCALTVEESTRSVTDRPALFPISLTGKRSAFTFQLSTVDC